MQYISFLVLDFLLLANGSCAVESSAVSLELSPSVTNVSNQLYQYLNDKETSFEMLAKYPLLQDLSIKMNTPLTSSAPVERLFSLAQIVNNPRRHALKDFSFEKLVVMKANAKKQYI